VYVSVRLSLALSFDLPTVAKKFSTHSQPCLKMKAGDILFFATTHIHTTPMQDQNQRTFFFKQPCFKMQLQILWFTTAHIHRAQVQDQNWRIVFRVTNLRTEHGIFGQTSSTVTINNMPLRSDHQK